MNDRNDHRHHLILSLRNFFVLFRNIIIDLININFLCKMPKI